MQILLLYTTFPELQVAENICATLLDEALIACANLNPNMVSLYQWQGKTERSSEVAAVLKTSAEKFDKLMERLTSLHPYDTPCMICLKPDNVGVKYLSWMAGCLKNDD